MARYATRRIVWDDENVRLDFDVAGDEDFCRGDKDVAYRVLLEVTR